MVAARRPWAADLLHFWFEELTPAAWFAPSAAIDAQCRARYLPWLRALKGQPAASFLKDPLTARAAVLLFDQIPRNALRSRPEAFGTDSLARAIARGALARGWDRGRPLHARQFLAMPLMHSERFSDQLCSLRLFTAMGNPQITRFARAHYRMIARFGRFPHRNALLGRTARPPNSARSMRATDGSKRRHCLSLP